MSASQRAKAVQFSFVGRSSFKVSLQVGEVRAGWQPSSRNFLIAGSTISFELPECVPPPPPPLGRQCYVTVSVADTDYDSDDEYIVRTVANGETEVHGKCSPTGGYYTCAEGVPVAPDANANIIMQTTATPNVDANPYEGSLVHMRQIGRAHV